MGIERAGLAWYAVETVDTIAALRSLRRQGFGVDDGRNGEVTDGIPLASEHLPAGYEVWRPMAVTQRKKRVRGRRHEEMRPVRESLFPGYVLARFDVTAPWQWMLEVNGVAGVLSLPDPRCPEMPPRPYALDGGKVDALRQEIVENGGALKIDHEGRRLTDKGKPKLLYAKGRWLRITGGPFTSFNAIVDDDVLTADSGRDTVAKLLVDIFGRTTPISLSVALVEPV